MSDKMRKRVTEKYDRYHVPAEQRMSSLPEWQVHWLEPDEREWRKYGGNDEAVRGMWG